MPDVSMPRSPTSTSSDRPNDVAQLLHLGLEGGGVRGVAREGLDRHRAALAVGQQAEHDLGAVGPVVAAVAVCRERAAAALHPGRGDVEQHGAAGCQVASREGPLDGRLARMQPVERVIELVLAGALHAELGGERRGREASVRWPASRPAPGCAPR